MDKLSVMQAFRRIVERGSFARAAEDLGVSPALLSREIRLLEESLGSALLIGSVMNFVYLAWPMRVSDTVTR